MVERDDRMYKITPEILRQVAGAPVSKKIVDGLIEHLPETLEKYEINTRLRIAHFLAQLAHESDHFRTYEEYASGQAYEGRRDLGNVKKGDGRRYKGRGPIQITGRYNYRKYGKLLGVDLENKPELASTPRIGTLIAGEYWNQNNLNDLADRDNGRQITRKINGGFNGLQDRLKKIEQSKKALSKAELVDKVRRTPDPEPVRQEEPVVMETPNTSVNELPLFVRMDLENNNG